MGLFSTVFYTSTFYRKEELLYFPHGLNQKEGYFKNCSVNLGLNKCTPQ